MVYGYRQVQVLFVGRLQKVRMDQLRKQKIFRRFCRRTLSLHILLHLLPPITLPIDLYALVRCGHLQTVQGWQDGHRRPTFLTLHPCTKALKKASTQAIVRATISSLSLPHLMNHQKMAESSQRFRICRS